MAAGKRKEGESFEAYRERLKAEAIIDKLKSRGRRMSDIEIRQAVMRKQIVRADREGK